MFFLKALVLHRAIKNAPHENILIKHEKHFAEIEEHLHSLELSFIAFKCRGDMLRWVAHIFGTDTFYNKVVKAKTLSEAKADFLLSWGAFAYSSRTGDFISL